MQSRCTLVMKIHLGSQYSVIPLKINGIQKWSFLGNISEDIFLMKIAPHRDVPIVDMLNQAKRGTPVSDLYRKHGMSNAGFYK